MGRGITFLMDHGFDALHAMEAEVWVECLAQIIDEYYVVYSSMAQIE